MTSQINCSDASSLTVLSRREMAQRYYEKAMSLQSLIQEGTGFDEAISNLDCAIALDPSYPGFYIQKALFLFDEMVPTEFKNAEKMDELMQILNQAISLDPLFEDKYCEMGDAQVVGGAIVALHPHPTQEMVEIALINLDLAASLGRDDASSWIEILKKYKQFDGIAEWLESPNSTPQVRQLIAKSRH